MNSMRKFTFSLGMVVSPSDSDEMLIKSLNSILNQSKQPDEIIILKNGRLNSFKIKLLCAFKTLLLDKVIFVENTATLDFAQALNCIIFQTKCDYIIRQDPDDISLHNRIEIIINEIEKNKFDFYHSSSLEFNRRTMKVLQKNIPVSLMEIRKRLLFINPIIHSTVTLSTQLLKKTNYYESAKLAEDYLLWLKIFQSNINVGFNQNPLIIFDSTHKLEKRSSKVLIKTEIKIFKYKILHGYNSYFSAFSFLVRISYVFVPRYIKNIFDLLTSSPVDNFECVNMDRINSLPLNKSSIE